MSATEPWICPNCNGTAVTPFCPECGERRLHSRDLTLRGLVDQIVKAFSSVDTRLIRSLRCLVNRPGDLTLAHLRGQRKPYIGPFPLFIIANLLFFATQTVTEVKIFSSPLESHLELQDWSAAAQRLVAERLAVKQTTLEMYTPVFNQAVALNAKSLIILMVLPFSLLLPVVFQRQRRPFAVHVVFALHLYAFLLLLFCVALAVSAVDVLFGGVGLASNRMDNILSVVNLAACAIFLHIATGKVYGVHGIAQIAQVATLTLAAAGIVLGYRYALFLITLYST